MVTKLYPTLLDTIIVTSDQGTLDQAIDELMDQRQVSDDSLLAFKLKSPDNEYYTDGHVVFPDAAVAKDNYKGTVSLKKFKEKELAALRDLSEYTTLQPYTINVTVPLDKEDKEYLSEEFFKTTEVQSLNFNSGAKNLKYVAQKAAAILAGVGKGMTRSEVELPEEFPEHYRDSAFLLEAYIGSQYRGFVADGVHIDTAENQMPKISKLGKVTVKLFTKYDNTYEHQPEPDMPLDELTAQATRTIQQPPKRMVAYQTEQGRTEITYLR